MYYLNEIIMYYLNEIIMYSINEIIYSLNEIIILKDFLYSPYYFYYFY
jgi:hypothetical protein